MTAAVHGKAFGGDDPVSADGHQTLSVVERCLHENFCHISGLISFPVRNQSNLFLLHIARRRLLASAHPPGQAALVWPAFLICDDGRDLVLSSQRGFKFTADRFCFRTNCTRLYTDLDFLPASILIFPFQTGSFYLDGPIHNRIAIQIGNDQIHIQGFSLLDKVAVCPQTNIKISRVNN